MFRSCILILVSWLTYQSSQAQSISFGSPYDRISFPISLSIGGGVTGNEGTNNRLTLYHGNSIALQTGDNNPTRVDGQNTRLFINGAGQVGIGTFLPSTRLDVRGGATSIDYLNVRSQDNAAEGGEISLSGSTGQPSWQMDIFNNTFRIHTNGSVPFQLLPSGTIVAPGKIGIGTAYPAAKVHITGGGMVLGANVIQQNTDGYLSLGDILKSSSPTVTNWGTSTTMLLNGLDYNTIGFHDSGDRVDFIRVGQRTIQLGYDGGWGPANVGLPNGVWNSDGNVGIGTTVPGSYRLAVEGKIGAREVEVKVGSWADFVFAEEYKLPSLQEVEAHIQARQHLPNMPSEADVKKNGYALGEMDAKLLQKIEELTLYVIQQQKRIDRLEEKIKTSNRETPDSIK